MGTQLNTLTVRGKSMNAAFNDACRDAKEEHGSDYYNGEINNTNLCKDVTAQHKAAKDKNKFIEEMFDKLSKGDCFGVELEAAKQNTNKTKSVVTPIVQKGTKKWETRYVAELPWTGEQVASEKTQGAAIKKARAYCEKHQCRCNIYVTKVMTKGDTKVAEVSYKQSKTEKDGKYLFIYAAPC
jgi:hypothetical protein